MKLTHKEKELIGRWVEENGKMRADAVCERIEWLTSFHLKKIAISKQWGAWEILFQDPDDDRYWEQTYSQSEMQGGGPLSLRCILVETVKAKYDL